MAPELAAAYVVGWFPSLAVTGVQYWLHERKRKSKSVAQLQKNLSLIDKYWCESQGKVLDHNEQVIAHDRDSFKKTILISGALFFFLSWLGFFLNLLILISIHYLAVSRLEKEVFSSDLARRDLTPDEAKDFFSSLSNF